MGIISKLICEYPLPVPFEEFTEKEKKYFEKVKWDELDFFTSSFFDYDNGLDSVCSYTISEDGQFYKSKITVELDHDDKGQVQLKEIDDGIERQEFTGEIYFGAEFLEEGNNDYVITFRALLYKGDVKELDLESWERTDNQERKLASEKLSEFVAQRAARKRTMWYSLSSPFKKAICLVIYLIRWIMSKTYSLLVGLENWILK
jgi:hypothetical protein